MINKRMNNSLKKVWLKKLFYICFFFLNDEFDHSLFFGERCERIAQVAHQKWAMWVNPSGRSPKMSDYEWFAQVAQRKWTIVSDSLRSLTKNERMSEWLIFLSESLIRSFLGKKQAILSEIRWANSQLWKDMTKKIICSCIFKYSKMCSNIRVKGI